MTPSRTLIAFYSFFMFFMSMFAIFIGLLSLTPEPLLPADIVVEQMRALVFWVLDSDEDFIPYLGNLLSAFCMFTLCALLGDISDVIERRYGISTEPRSFLFLMRFLYHDQQNNQN